MLLGPLRRTADNRHRQYELALGAAAVGAVAVEVRLVGRDRPPRREWLRTLGAKRHHAGVDA